MTLDLTRPGPAGLYFRTDRLTPAGLAQDRAARARLETRCTICGSIPAPYGFGRHAACDAPASPGLTSPDLFSRPEAA